MRVQVGRQRKEILQLQKAGISTASAEALLQRMLEKIDTLCADRDRMEAEVARGPDLRIRQADRRHPGASQDVMDNLRRFPAPWTMEEDERGFHVKDGSGAHICGVPHREDLHGTNYQYANNFLSREEARRIAMAISRLPELLKRPPY